MFVGFGIDVIALRGGTGISLECNRINGVPQIWLGTYYYCGYGQSVGTVAGIV